MQEAPPVNWDAINTGVLILSGLLTGATVYLRMFINGRINALEGSIMTKIESKFSQKEIVDLKIGEHERRLVRIETKMENIRIQKIHDDE